MSRLIKSNVVYLLSGDADRDKHTVRGAHDIYNEEYIGQQEEWTALRAPQHNLHRGSHAGHREVNGFLLLKP
jgi:hypothetical protein